MQRPNIILILCDQLRRQALGCYGDPDARTPNLDALAQDGLRCDAAVASYPVCVPYRFTLMTGQPAHSRLVPAIHYRMSPAERTLADRFNEAGYQTLYVGKWHLDGRHTNPVQRSHQGRWQTWHGTENKPAMQDPVLFDEQEQPIQLRGYHTDANGDHFIEQFCSRAGGDRPVLGVLSEFAPHPPLEPPVETLERWRDRDLHLPANIPADAQALAGVNNGDRELGRFPQPGSFRAAVLDERRRYHAMLEHIDGVVSRLRARLQREGLAENTVILFTADHGELGGAHGRFRKCDPFEESVGVPLLVFDPRQPGGRVCSEATHTEDLLPTLCGLAGIAVDEDLPGADLTGIWADPSRQLDRTGVAMQFVGELRAGFAYHHQAWRGWLSRDGRWKYTLLSGPGGARPWQLFDLAEDPRELHNRVGDPAYAETRAQLHADCRADLQARGDHFLREIVEPPTTDAVGTTLASSRSASQS